MTDLIKLVCNSIQEYVTHDLRNNPLYLRGQSFPGVHLENENAFFSPERFNRFVKEIKKREKK